MKRAWITLVSVALAVAVAAPAGADESVCDLDDRSDAPDRFARRDDIGEGELNQWEEGR